MKFQYLQLIEMKLEYITETLTFELCIDVFYDLHLKNNAMVKELGF